MAIILNKYCINKNIDIFKVVKMLLIHDIIEINTGDVSLYDKDGKDKAKISEPIAAVKIFGLLPNEQKNELLNLWKEFEARDSWEAKYAAAMDNLQPIINHLLTANIEDKKLTKSQIIQKKEFIKQIAPELWDVCLELIDESVKKEIYEDK